jgi:hypothetical protein
MAGSADRKPCALARNLAKPSVCSRLASTIAKIPLHSHMKTIRIHNQNSLTRWPSMAVNRLCWTVPTSSTTRPALPTRQRRASLVAVRAMGSLLLPPSAFVSQRLVHAPGSANGSAPPGHVGSEERKEAVPPLRLEGWYAAQCRRAEQCALTRRARPPAEQAAEEVVQVSLQLSAALF